MTNTIEININGSIILQVLDGSDIVIQDGKINVESTELSIWQADVQENRKQMAKNLKKFPYFIRKGWGVDALNIEFNELHNDYEELKQEAPDGWAINKEGYAVQL
jgi:hypothetical protein